MAGDWWRRPRPRKSKGPTNCAVRAADPFGIWLLKFSREPMFVLLLSCGLLYWVLGDRQEALILLGFVFFIMAITITQDWKTERALSALRDLSSPRAVVVRDGVQKRIAGWEVVEGDRLILSEGDRVPADARLLSASHLAVDESLLTGNRSPFANFPRGKMSRTPLPAPAETICPSFSPAR
jgi:Ca2+-transporting ATPase